MMSLTSAGSRRLWDPRSLTDLSEAPNGPEAGLACSGGSRKRHSSERVDSKVTGRQSEGEGGQKERLVTDQMLASRNRFWGWFDDSLC